MPVPASFDEGEAVLKTLEVKNFTAFPEAQLDFAEGLNVIIGENGTGKTHLLKLPPDYVPSSSCSIDRVDCAVGSVQRAPTRSEWAARRHVSGPNPVPVPVWSLEHEVRT